MSGNPIDLEGSSPLSDYDGLLRYLTEHTDLSPNQARELIARYGHDRKTLMEKARNHKAEG